MVSLTNKLLPLLLLTLLPSFLVAQQIKNFSYRMTDNKIEVSYTLGGAPAERYDVRLYSSYDGYKTPVQLVKGDVGKNIIPGTEKKIIWDAKNELIEYEGELALKLKVQLIPLLDFNITKGEKYKRGKAKTISWKAYDPVKLDLDLYQGNQKVTSISVLTTTSSYSWYIPKNIKTGHDYKIKASGNGRYAFSEPFTIKRKVPLIVWVLPAAVIGVVVGILINKDEQSEPIALPINPN